MTEHLKWTLKIYPTGRASVTPFVSHAEEIVNSIRNS